MPPLYWVSFTVILFSVFFNRDVYALEQESSSKTWHSYVFNSAAGKREGLKLSNLAFSDIALEKQIHKWQALTDQDGVLLLGLGRTFVQVLYYKNEDTYSDIKDIGNSLIDIAVFQKWSSKSRKTENFAIVASCDADVECLLDWYRIKQGNLTHIWSWSYTRKILHIKVLSFDYELQLLIISQSHTNLNNASAEIYSFSTDQIRDLWLSDMFSLDENPSTTSVSDCNHDTFLSFVFPKMEMIFIYKHLKSDSGHSHFIFYQKIHSKGVISSSGFCFRYHCYFAVASSNSTIYKFNGNSGFTSVGKQSFGNLRNWFVLSINTYHKDKILLADGENETAIVHLSSDKDLEPVNNLSNAVCETDYNCNEELKRLSSIGATTFFYNEHYHIVYTTNTGNSKFLTFSVKVQPLPDNVELQLTEIYTYISSLQEQLKEQEVKKKKLDEALRKIANEFTNNSEIYWTLKNVKADSVSVKENPNATIDSFEYAMNKNWFFTDYSDYLDLLAEPRSEDLLSNKINEITSLFQEFERADPIETKKFTGLLLDDVSFLGSVTVNQLELSQLNGIDVTDMLQNSLMLGHERKIGGIKTVTNISADHIFFQNLGDIPAYDLIFSDELIENKNTINGMLVYENDVEILDGLELLPAEKQPEPFALHPFHHGFSFTDEIVFDHLSVTEDSVIKETLNGWPLILPVHSSPFDMFAFENMNQGRVEMIRVENNLTLGFINGINIDQFMKPKKHSEFLTTNLVIEYLNDIKFPEGFVGINLGKSIYIDNKNFTGSLIVQKLKFQDKRSEDYLKDHSDVPRVRIFKDIEIRERLTTEKLNNYTWEQLDDLVKKENKGEVQQLIGAKHFKKCKFTKNLATNSQDLDNIMNNYSIQESSNLSFNEVVFHNLNISGYFDRFRIEDVKESIVRISQNKKYESTLYFVEEVEPYFNSLEISSSINNVSDFATGFTTESIKYGNMTFEAFNITNLIINGTLTYYDQGGNVNPEEPSMKSIYQSYLQKTERRPSKTQENLLNPPEKSTADVMKNINLDTVYALLNSGSNIIKSIAVKGNIITQKGINGYNLTDFEKNAVHINKTSVVNRKLVFEDLVEFKKLRINGRLQGFHLKLLNQDLVFDSSYVFLKATKNFIGNLTVLDKLKARTLNGHAVQRILTKEGDHSIKGAITINGDVTVRGNISSYGSVNEFSVGELLKKYSMKHNSYVIPNDIQLQFPEIDHLVVEGAIQNNSLSSLLEEVVTVENDSYITARKVILGSVNFENSITVEETLNGLNISYFNDDIVLINKDVEVQGDLIMGKTIIKSLKVKGDLNATLIHGFDTNDWLEESILLDKSVSISGYKNFKDAYSFNSIAADYINNYLTINAIPLNEEQFVPCSGHFVKLTSFSDVNVGHSVNGKILRSEFEDTVLVDEEQEIKAPFIFMNDFTVENSVQFEDTKLKNLLNVTTLYTDQAISSVIFFEDEVITNSDIDNLEFINGIDVRKWNEQSVSLNESQVINGTWFIEGNVTVNKNVEGDGLLDGQSITDIGKSIAKYKMLTMDIENKRMSDFRNQCEIIANLSGKLSLQPSTFHHLEVSQVLKSSAAIESVIVFQANNNHYLMLTFFNECISMLYQWNGTVSKFNYLNRMNIGPVSKWITLYHKNMMYLITSSSNDIICEENSKRGNIWLFDGDRYKYGHLFTSEGFNDIVTSNTSDKYYTLGENGDIVEWTIEPKISAKVLFNLGNGNYEFLDFKIFGELAFSNRREVKNKQNMLIHTFSKPYHSKIVATRIKEKTLIVVPYQDELVIYENILEQKIYATIPAVKVGSVLWLNAGSQHPSLLYETEQKSVEIVHFRGAKNIFKKVAIPMPSKNLILKTIPREKHLRPLEFVIVVHKKSIFLLEAFYFGNMYVKTDKDHCE